MCSRLALTAQGRFWDEMRSHREGFKAAEATRTRPSQYPSRGDSSFSASARLSPLRVA